MMALDVAVPPLAGDAPPATLPAMLALVLLFLSHVQAPTNPADLMTRAVSHLPSLVGAARSAPLTRARAFYDAISRRDIFNLVPSKPSGDPTCGHSGRHPNQPDAASPPEEPANPNSP